MSESKCPTRRIGQIIHGTTLATNALIERRGAKTALITTQGFRDVIEMRTESRFEQYDLNLILPEPLLPRQQRYTLPERIAADGDVLIPLARGDVEALVDEIRMAGYESVAVGLLHSYANDAHERLVGEVLAERMPDAMVSLSSQVSPQMREYERFNTVVANAYIKPLMKSYLGRLEGRLESEGIRCPIFLMHSGGGIISLESAAEFPVRLVESGPAGGAVFAANIAARYGLDKVISFDMGGTTAKICLIKNQTPRTSRVFEVARSYRFKKGSGMPISIPVIDMVEIGAGGGSLAHVDAMRQIRVGPESAGSDPGPACYGRGGDRPQSRTPIWCSADWIPTTLPAGRYSFTTTRRNWHLKKLLAIRLKWTQLRPPSVLAEVVDENMANAARVHAVENGEDLSDYTMIAFGGAAPLHAGRLCEKLGTSRCLVPPGAGVGSAIGFLRAPFSFEANRSIFMRLSDFDSDRIRAFLQSLKRRLRALFVHAMPTAEILPNSKSTCAIPVRDGKSRSRLRKRRRKIPMQRLFQALFEADYTVLFGRPVDGMDVEVTVWAVNATTPSSRVIPVSQLEVRSDAAFVGSRAVFDPASGRVFGNLNRSAK